MRGQRYQRYYCPSRSAGSKPTQRQRWLLDMNWCNFCTFKHPSIFLKNNKTKTVFPWVLKCRDVFEEGGREKRESFCVCPPQIATVIVRFHGEKSWKRFFLENNPVVLRLFCMHFAGTKSARHRLLRAHQNVDHAVGNEENGESIINYVLFNTLI